MAKEKDLVDIFEGGMRRSQKPTGGIVHKKDRDTMGRSCKGIPKDVAISIKKGCLRVEE